MKNTEKFMLNKLFGSTSRVKILKFLLSHPDEHFYIRQIAREIDLQLNSVRRELDNLQLFGILKTTNEPPNVEGEETEAKKIKISKTDKKYYKVDKEFVLFEEIEALFVKAHILYEQEFAEKVLDVCKPKLMILTGIFVNVNNALTDLLIVGNLDRDKLIETIKELESEMGRELNYTIMDMKEYIYRRDITDVFLYGILEGKKMVVVDELEIS